jgi:hypothetical protein
VGRKPTRFEEKAQKNEAKSRFRTRKGGKITKQGCFVTRRLEACATLASLAYNSAQVRMAVRLVVELLPMA